MYKTKIVLAGSAALLLSACGNNPVMSKDFGVSTRNNIANQILDPKASERDVLPPTLDGVKAEKAIDRYRKDRPDDSRAKLVEDNK